MNVSEWRRRREFVRRVRLAAHATVELSEAYRRVVQARKRPLRRRVAAGFLALLALAAFVGGSLAFLNALLSRTYRAHGPDSILVALSVFQTCWACGVGSGLLGGLRRSTWMTIVSVLPVRDSRIAWWAWCFAANFAAITLYPTMWGLGFVAFAEGLEPIGWFLALEIGLEQAVVAMAIATLLAVRWPSFPLATVTQYGLLTSIAFFAIYFFCGAPGLPMLAAVIYAVLPAGWLNAVFHRACLEGVAWDWYGLVPASLVVAAGVLALVRLIRTHRIREFRFLSGVPALADSELWTARAASLDFRFLRNRLWWLTDAASARYASPAADRSVDEAAIVARSRFRLFAREHDVPKSRLDRWQRRLLTPREADLFVYMTANGHVWNDRYPKCLAVQVACALLALLLLAARPPLNYVALLAFAQLQALLHLYGGSGAWLGFSAAPFGGACVSRYALLPVGFNDISRMLLKVAAFRCSLLIPHLLCVMCTVSVATDSTSHWLEWLLAGAGVAFAIFIAQRSIVATGFAETMSWPTRWYWRLGRAAVAVRTIKLLAVLGGITSPLIIIILRDSGWEADLVLAFFIYSILMVLLGLASSAAWLVVRAMYRRGIVDLVRDRPSAGQRALLALEQGQYPAQAGVQTRL